jgi:hypothetical protein
MKFFLLILALTPQMVFSSIANFEGKWPKRDLSVCFSNTLTDTERIQLRPNSGVSLNDAVDFNNEEKRTIRSTLMENFSLDDVGINFFGFKDCSENFVADIYVMKFVSEDIKTPAGWVWATGNPWQNKICHNEDCSRYTLEYRSDFEQPYVALNLFTPTGRKTSDLDRLRLLVLHEFGHIAGLYHEHLRSERNNDRNCRNIDGLGNTWDFEPDYIFGHYDPNSIMSYCYLRMVNWVVGLDFYSYPYEELPILLTDPSIFSQKQEGNRLRTLITPKLSFGDRETLRCLYIYDSAVFKERCIQKSVDDQ